MTTVLAKPSPAFGGLLRNWRQTRRISQLELSSVSGVSSRHLSFIETGRATPSREMVLRLADELDVPLRERNALLQSAGYAPAYGETPLDSPEMTIFGRAIETVLNGHMPYPALALDPRRNIVRANKAVSLFTDGLPSHLTGPDANSVRITLHPDGLAPRLLDHALIRASMLRKLRRHAAATGDAVIAALADECASYPHPDEPVDVPLETDIVMPFRLRDGAQELSMFSAIATFGTAMDLTAAELSIETFFPADAATEAYLRARV